MGEEEFSELFQEFFHQLLRVAWRICGSYDIAEELTQEAFLRYYERRHKLPGGQEARYWLIRVVRNLALNYEKRLGREHKAVGVYARQPRDIPGNEGERRLLEEESRESVRLALAQVPYKQRVALILKEYAGYPYADIAKILRISESNVKIRVFRARQRLAQILKKEDIHVP
ncbi:MAG: RNA polymerase subunit sigma-24 [Spirochaetales bacterium]|nr:MAG: RNA polymerase subunit sigma-24 [Spirochaetales bacterium]